MAGSAGLRAMERKPRDLGSSLHIAPVTPDKGRRVVHHGIEKEKCAEREDTKKKRYRPRVIQEGRPAKTLKHATEAPMPVTPAAGEDNRKKGITLADMSPCDTCVATCCNRQGRLAMRSLNFDLVSKDTGFENQEYEDTCSLPGKLGADGKKPHFVYVYHRNDRSRKGLDHHGKSIPSDEKGPKCVVLYPALAAIVEEKNLNKIHEGYIQDIESLGKCNCSRVIVPYADPIDGAILDRNLPLGTADQQLSLTLYSGNDSLVPHKHNSNKEKKGWARPRVVLDEDTIRAWNFLMGAEENEGDGGFHADSKIEKEQERFHELVKLFIARMHLVQGDRSFSQWKGSVVDSVVGAFLTQNVSDHQSSSAFMALAAKFPLKFGEKKVEVKTGKMFVRKKRSCKLANKERSRDRRDSLDWEAVKDASISVVAKTIESRGMNNKLAKRIKRFLVRLTKDHGSIDLEWLREVPLSKARKYLLGIRGLGLKSVECIRLLALSHAAFPVDTNVGRICVRLGWVPLEPQLESILIHELEQYPLVNTIHKYLWPRLCKLDQRTLYELHYQMITFGKVFCTKRNPNCNACPMRGDCKHFASAYASVRLSLPRPEEKSLAGLMHSFMSESNFDLVSDAIPTSQTNERQFCQDGTVSGSFEPFLQEPAASLEPECIGTVENGMEDPRKPASPESGCMGTGDIDLKNAFLKGPDEIPTIRLNMENFRENIQEIMCANGMGNQDDDMLKAIVAISPEDASVPSPKLKNISRLRTTHLVYELPDSHPLLEKMDKREPDDQCPYLLAIWTQGETAKSVERPESCCCSRDMDGCCGKSCVACDSMSELEAQTVKATILIPCRTAMKGSFPLNGTYFQVNELFADHESSCAPLTVSRESIWNLKRRTVYIGTSTQAIFKGLAIEPIQQGFWRGFVCFRGFDRRTRAPMPLHNRLHFNGKKKTPMAEY